MDELRRLKIDRAFWRDRPVFVTGATGLLGSSLVDALVACGADVVALVRDFVPRSRFFHAGERPRVTVVSGSVEDAPLMERVLNEYAIETVFHLAAQTIVGTAFRNPVSTFESNIRGTYNLLEGCRRSPSVKRVLVASSDKAYGHQDKLPYDEETPLVGRAPYDVSKSCTDLIAQSYHATYKLPVCVTRCGNFFGPGDLNWDRIVPGTIRSIVRGTAPVIRSDGTYVRDYVYVLDAVAAYMQLGEGMSRPEVVGQAFNFSYERPIAVRDLVKTLLDRMKSKLEPVILGQAQGEIHSQYLSARKAKQMLGWTPTFGFDEALDRTIDWYQRTLQTAS